MKNCVFTWRFPADDALLNKLFQEGWSVREQVILPKRNERKVLFILEKNEAATKEEGKK